MKKTITGIFLFSLITGLFIINSLSTNAQTAVRRVILEDVTGAWCQWCPLGIQAIEDIMKKYPDKVYGIGVHTGDAMQCTDGSTLVNALGINAVPSGFADRYFALDQNQNPTWKIPPSYWDQIVTQLLGQAPKVGVDLQYSIEPSTRVITANVYATFVEQVNLECRFNVFVIEDEVTGTGSGYDQVNQLSNNPQYSGHPFYSKPNPIKGFKHMHVLRGAMGGTWGQANSLPIPITTGTKYKYTFTYTVPSTINIDKMELIGTVQLCARNAQGQFYADGIQMLNSIKGRKFIPTTELTYNGSDVQNAGTGESGVMTVSIKNISPNSLVYTWKIDKSGRTPSDWTGSLEPNTSDIVVAAGQTAQLSFKLSPGAKVGVGDATLTITEKAIPTNKYTVDLTVLSKDVERLQVIGDAAGGTHTIASNLTTAGYDNFIDVKPSDITNPDELSKLKTIIWTGGEIGALNPVDGQNLNTLLLSGKNIMLMGHTLAAAMNQVASGLQTQLGMRYLGPCYQGYSTPNQILIAGIENDPVTNGYETIGKIKYLTSNLAITNVSTTKPLLKHKFADTVFAVRAQINNARAIVISIAPNVITDVNKRQELIKKCVDWLEGKGGSGLGPQIQLSTTEIKFDKVDVGKSKTDNFIIKNTGDQPLSVNQINMDGAIDPDGVFKMKNLPSLPFDIAPSAEMQFTVEFTPKTAASYLGSVIIKTNSLKNPDELISLEGEGQGSGSTGEFVTSDASVKMSVSPSPASNFAKLEFNISGTETKSINISIIDMTGKQINSVTSGDYLPGSYQIGLPASDLSAGTYYLIARINGEILNIPFVIVR